MQLIQHMIAVPAAIILKYSKSLFCSVFAHRSAVIVTQLIQQYICPLLFCRPHKAHAAVVFPRRTGRRFGPRVERKIWFGLAAF